MMLPPDGGRGDGAGQGAIVLAVAEREALESLVRRRSTGQATALRARMIAHDRGRY
jgi:hypothetical protein